VLSAVDATALAGYATIMMMIMMMMIKLFRSGVRV